MKKQIATNTFSEGMTLDLNPLVTPSNVITNCLNGTLVTMNGNELMLQNDMGNGRVETATLPEGYVPIGTCSHGGFIYIVSYNPLKDLAQIGSFPSPERNIDTTELSDLRLTLTEDEFYLTGNITTDKNEEFKPLKPIIRKVFDQKVLNPGDKYIVFASKLYTKNLSDVDSPSHTLDSIPRDWKIRIASMEDSGKITEFDNIKWYNQTVKDENGVDKEIDYYIKEDNSIETKLKGEIVDLDDYRTLVNSAYSIFESKRSGKLCLLISPEMIDGFNCSYSLYQDDNSEIREDTSEVIPYKEIDPDKEEEVINPGDGTLDPKPDDGTKPDENNPETNPDENNPETKPDNGTNQDKVIQLWINSSWTNSGRDINPEGIIVKFKDKYYKYPFTNSQKFSEEGKYTNSEDRFISEYSQEKYKNNLDIKNTFITDALAKNYSDYYNKRIIYREYINNVPTTQYYLGLTSKPEYRSYSVNADFLNNYFSQDVPIKVSDLDIVNLEKDITDSMTSKEKEDKRKENYNSNVYKVEVWPYMRTGYLPQFKREFTINLNEIGKSETKLTQWKYYVREEDMYLDWALTTNLPLNKTISKVWLEFYDNQGLCATQILDGLSSYNGNFQTSINFGRPSSYFGITGKKEDGTIIKHRGFEVSYSKELDSSIKDETVFPVEVSADGTIEGIISFDDWKELSEDKKAGYKYYQNDSGILYKGIPYLVLIKYKTSKLSTFNNDESEPIELDYRWLWTAPVFNSFYDIKEDFKDLQPTLELNLDVQYSTNSNYKEQSKLYTNSKNVSFNREEDLTRLSANVQYVEDTSTDSKGNVDANVTLLLNDDFGTFRIDKDNGVKNFKLRTYLKKSKCEAPAQPSIIKEELNSGHTELLETSNENENITLTKVLKELLDSNKEIKKEKELWETSDKSFNNQYQFTLPNLAKITGTLTDATENDSREYLPSIEAEDKASKEKSNDLKGSTYSENSFTDTGKVNVPISCEIINYSKFFTTCEDPIVKTFTVLRRAIEKISDLSKYNLTRDADGNVAFKTALNLYTYYKDGGSDRAETRVVRCSYSKFTGDIYKDILEYDEQKNKYGGFSDSYNDTADEERLFKAYYNTNSCVQITQTEANGIGKSGDSYWPLETVLANSSKNISTINTEASFIFPVLTVSDKHTQNENTNSWVQRTKVAAYYDNEGQDSAKYFQFQADNQIDFQWDQTNKYRCYFGGNLGLSVEDNIIIDFNHPITAWKKGWNQYGQTSMEAWFPTITTGEDALHFYAPAVLGLLYSLIYRQALTEQRRIYSYDNYTYYEPFTTSYKQDMVYRVFYTSSNNANNDVLVLGKFKLGEYINTILKTVSSQLENLNQETGSYQAESDKNVTLTFKECIKTVPLQFNINYKQPQLIRNSFEGYGLFDSKLIELPDMSDLYVENFRTKELESLTEVSEFLPARINNSSIERLKEYSDYSEIVIKPEGERPVNYYNSRGYIFNIPVLYNYLKVENNTIKIKKEISSQVSKMSNNKNIRAHSDRWIYNLTKIDIFTGVDQKHAQGGNYRVVNIYNKSLE